MRDMAHFLFKSFFIHFLVVVLVDGPSPVVIPFLTSQAFASEASSSMDFDSLYSLYRDTANRRNFKEIIAGNETKELIDIGQKFIADPANLEQLKSEEGKTFLNLHNKLARLHQLKSDLDNCISDEDDQQKWHGGLPDRIFDAVMMTPSTDIPCSIGLFEADSVESLMTQVKGVTNEMGSKEMMDELNNFQEQIHLKGLANSAKTLMNLKYTYDGNVSGKESLSEEDINSIFAADLCGDEIKTRTGRRRSGSGPQTYFSSNCSNIEKRTIVQAAQEEFNRLKASNAPTYTKSEAATVVREKISNINKVIDENPVKINDDWFDNYIDKEDEGTQSSLQNYVSTYMEETSSGPGLLMWTDAIRDEMGGRRDTDEASFFGWFGGGFDEDNGRLKRHEGDIYESQITGAIDEASRRVKEQTNGLLETEDKRQFDKGKTSSNGGARSRGLTYAENISKRKESLKDMVKVNPVLAGQVLVDNPQHGDELCAAINSVIQESKDNEGFGFGDFVMWGGIIVGGALLAAATGGLALMAFGAVASGTAAGIAASTAAVATFKGLAVAGFAYGVVESGVYGTKYYQANRDRNELLNAYISGAGDQETAQQFLETLDEAEDALINAGVAVGFTLLDVPGAVAIARSIKAGSTAADAQKYLSELADALKYIKGSPKLKNILKTVEGSLGPEKVRLVFKQMSQLDGKMNFLKKIENLSDEDAIKLFRHGSEVCETLCG